MTYVRNTAVLLHQPVPTSTYDRAVLRYDRGTNLNSTPFQHIRNPLNARELEQ
jgi:hypothetical protein